MASSSTSSIHKSFKYDVFLSFRGEDTRTNFVDHLYHALQQNSIHTYKDDERIKKGKNISDELIGSIEDSKFYIIIFSKNYASSSWCLDELVKIMECHRTIEHTAYPIFYDVEPSEVRKQSGAVAKAFAKHEKEEAAGIWREALKEVANLAGWELKNTADGHESKFIQKIVEQLSLELRSISFNIDEKLVGMESRINDVLSIFGTGGDDVRMMGIKGIGGGGKTTLARAIFDQISFQFEGKSFVENVREVSNTSLSGLRSLQTQVLLDVLDDKDIRISSVFEGKHMMQRRMRGKKVLVVLDDVDHIDQLEALAGETNWFMAGSRIIITTRDEQVLVAHGVEFRHDVNLLSNTESISLFNRHAFGRKIPVQEYDELSRQVVHYAAGLPLTIKVLGSFLCGKHKLEWIDALDRLKTIPLAETLKKLEVSYVALEKDYKDMFLDVACIMKGWRQDDAIKALECCGFHARNGLKVLQQKSLLTIYDSYDIHDNYKYVGMHDHIQEMGRNIVRRSHPHEPHKHTHMWIYEEIENVLANNLGTKATMCILIDTQIRNQKFDIKGLGKMKKLRFLSVGPIDPYHYHNWDSNLVNPEFPNGLQYLCLQYYPFTSLPATFQAKNLVGLKMVGSEIVKLWEARERKVLNNLRFLDLSCSMLRTLDLRIAPNLEKLDLGSCSKLVDLYMPVACLKLMYINLGGSSLITALDLRLSPNLEELIISFCRNLERLLIPSRCINLRSLLLGNLKLGTLNIGLKPNLKKLNVEDCYNLEELNMAYECQKLSYLNASYSRLRTLDLGMTPNLETLHLRLCCHLEELHMPVEFLKLKYVNLEGSSLSALDLRLAPNLEELHLVECNNLKKLHMPSRCLNLRSLLLTKSKLRTLDIGRSPNLKNLDLKENYDLEELDMADECQMLANLDISHSRLKSLDLRLTPNIESLDLNGCYNLVQLFPPIGGLKKLVHLYLRSLRFTHFSFDIKDYTSCSVDEPLEVGPLPELDLTAESTESCRIHPESSLPKFQFSCNYKEDQPSLTRNIDMLLSLGMCACTNLQTFSEIICGLQCLKKLKLQVSTLQMLKDLNQLECLEELSLSSMASPIKYLPDSICMLKNLKSLELKSCFFLEKLPEDLGQLGCLEKLRLSDTSIKCLPDSICMLKHLEYLQLSDCGLLEKLPKEFGRLECLKELNIRGTSIDHLPQSIMLLKGLYIVASRELLELCGFTSEIQTSEYDDTFCYAVVG